jgi:hypothetical protein
MRYRGKFGGNLEVTLSFIRHEAFMNDEQKILRRFTLNCSKLA